MGCSRRLLDQRGECILKQNQTQVASGADKITPFLILLIKTTVFSVCPKQAFFFSQQNIAVAQGVPQEVSEAPRLHPNTEIPPSKPRIHFVWGHSSCVPCSGSIVHLFHAQTRALTGRLNVTEYTSAL